MASSGRGVNPTVPIRAEKSSSGDPNRARQITVECCRKQLGNACTLQDSELEALLDSLYALANVCVDAFIERRQRSEMSSESLRVVEMIDQQPEGSGESLEAQ